MEKEELENLEIQSRLEVYLKYLSLHIPDDTEQTFKTSNLETFITSDNQKFKVKVA